MRRQPKFNTFTCFLLSKLSTSKLPFFKTSNPHFLISNSVFSFQSSVSFISKPVFPVSKLRFSQLRPCFFISPSCFILPIPCFSYFDPYSTLPEANFSHLTPSFIHLKSQSQLSQTQFSYHNRFKPVFKNACILVLGIRK